MAIKCGNCKSYHDSVPQVRACHEAGSPVNPQVTASMQAAAPKGDQATDKQLTFLAKLADQKPQAWAKVFDGSQTVQHLQNDMSFTKQYASRCIDFLVKAPKEESTSQAAPIAELPDGVYVYEGKFYKLVHAVAQGSGKQYAKVLVQDEEYEDQFSWEYAGRKPLHYLDETMRLTAEAAAAFGLLYGVCVRCARTLTDERSISVGYGSTCAGYEGWPYPTKAQFKAQQASA